MKWLDKIVTYVSEKYFPDTGDVYCSYAEGYIYKVINVLKVKRGFPSYVVEVCNDRYQCLYTTTRKWSEMQRYYQVHFSPRQAKGDDTRIPRVGEHWYHKLNQRTFLIKEWFRGTCGDIYYKIQWDGSDKIEETNRIMINKYCVLIDKIKKMSGVE